jgi:hypothetical protein
MVPKLCQRYGARSGNDSRFLLSSSSAFSRDCGFVRSSTSCSIVLAAMSALNIVDAAWRQHHRCKKNRTFTSTLSLAVSTAIQSYASTRRAKLIYTLF